MTPMIDVVFQLLIFFLCTTNFQALEELLPTHLRAAGSTSAAAPLDPDVEELEDVVVKVAWSDAGASWQVNGRPYAAWDEVRGTLAKLVELAPNLPVILDVAPDVPLGTMIDLYDLCRLLGFEKVQFAASAKS